MLQACCGWFQAGSKRVLNAKSDKFQGNIHKRGKVQDVSPVSPAVSALRTGLSTKSFTAILDTEVWSAEKQQQSCCGTNNAWFLSVCSSGVR